jgi:hypothetical protein
MMVLVRRKMIRVPYVDVGPDKQSGHRHVRVTVPTTNFYRSCRI